MNTVIGVILTAIMLFPLYWMINVSLTQPTELRKDPPNLFPFNPTFDGYSTRPQRAAALPRHEPRHRARHRARSRSCCRHRPPSRSRSCARAGGTALDFVLLIAQMIPSIIMAMGFYLIFFNWGILDTVPGLILADSTLAVPFAVLIFTAFMAGIPDELMNGREDRRRVGMAHLPVGRSCR